MLKNAVETIRPPGVEIFMSPVDTVMNPNYIDYIFHPMDLGTISQKVRRFLGYSDVGDIVMLVTLWWWPIWDVGDRIIMLVIFFVMLVIFPMY